MGNAQRAANPLLDAVLPEERFCWVWSLASWCQVPQAELSHRPLNGSLARLCCFGAGPVGLCHGSHGVSSTTWGQTVLSLMPLQFTVGSSARPWARKDIREVLGIRKDFLKQKDRS